MREGVIQRTEALRLDWVVQDPVATLGTRTEHTCATGPVDCSGRGKCHVGLCPWGIRFFMPCNEPAIGKGISLWVLLP